MIRFANAPSGRTIQGLTAERAANGNLHLFVRYDDGSVGYTWQRANETAWNGAGGGRSAGRIAFAPRP